MTIPEDLSKTKFGFFIVLNRGVDYIRSNGKKEVRWLCRCVCGNTRLVARPKILKVLHTGKGYQSCGCMKNTLCTEINTKHGHCKKHRNSREWNTYWNMRNRCYIPSTDSFIYYGGRGIKVCDHWLGKSGFVNFLNDMGTKPKGMTIERKNVDGDYTPDNCKWATPLEQVLNRRKRYKFWFSKNRFGHK